MGGNTGVRRDVLRWLVALSLSFPIKNIKRDFSNGFLVAEIFSRYFPHDIQMHSYDYGTKMEKKRDNWTQLQKFFKKRSFVVLKDEIETIISCQTPDGAGYLLERMYKFLTMKRCKPEEAEAEKKQVAAQQEWKQQQRATTNSEVATIPSVPVSARVEFVSQFSQRVEVTTTAAAADQRTSVVCSCTRSGPPCLNAACQHFITRVSTSYQSSGVLLPLQSNSVRFSSCGVYNEVDNSSPPKTRIDCRSDEENIQEKDKGSGLSAVERARQREAPPTAAAAADPVGKPIGRKTTTSDAVALAFRSPHRQRKFKQYTINDYRLQQTAGCVQLGKLGPDLEDEELGEKRERLERMKNFGRIVRSCNTAQVSVPKKTKTPPLSKRQKALEFAAMVPKPKVKVKVEVEKPATPEKNPHQLSALEILQAKHAADTQHVEAMRRELEIFLR